jgi:hypothetical protein
LLQLINKSKFTAKLMMAPDARGIDTLFTIIKGTFILREGGLAIAPEQLPVVQTDEFHGEPGKSSIKTPSDISLTKPGVDLLVSGHAYAPGGRASQADVAFRIGSFSRALRVVGNRVWSNGFLGAKASEPEPFDKMPLVWERAFGGFDADPAKPEVVKAEDRNPVGTGFRFVKKHLEGTHLPNIEDPAKPIRGWQDRPAPIGTAPIAGAWQPRRAFAGTYDEAWQKSRAPYLPKDFDPRFSQIAPPEQILPALEGGESVELLNLTPSGRLTFSLPKFRVTVSYNIDGQITTPPVKIDTCLLEPDANRCVLVWRTAAPCDKNFLKVREVLLDAAPIH